MWDLKDTDKGPTMGVLSDIILEVEDVSLRIRVFKKEVRADSRVCSFIYPFIPIVYIDTYTRDIGFLI